MTINTPEIRPVRRGIFGSFLASSASPMDTRHSSYPGSVPQDWPGSGWQADWSEAVLGGTAGVGPGAQPAAAGKAYGRNPKPLGGWPKRALDLAVASAAVLPALPLMLVVTILIKVFVGGPVLFSHRRIGFNGKPFDCYKFRTMVENAEQVLENHLVANPQAAAEWQETRKLKKDPRITLLGRILRKSSIDELPQLVNVFRGEMSCVGPRPIVADELPRYGAVVDEYLKARPGLTGLWQVSGRDCIDYADRVLLDAHYVNNWSIWSDLVILASTALAVMRFDQAS